VQTISNHPRKDEKKALKQFQSFYGTGAGLEPARPQWAAVWPCKPITPIPGRMKKKP
jgi:hypothetical protein